MKLGRASLRLLGLATGASLALLAMTSPASAATTSRVNVLGCVEQGGQVTRPAGTELEVALGVIVKNRGLATDFLRMQQTTISIDGGSPIDISEFWGDPEPITLSPYGDVWITRIIYDTGVILGQGEATHFQFVLDEPHLYLDDLVFVSDQSQRPELYRPAVYTYDCTVTGT
jgi:hypothetical protein